MHGALYLQDGSLFLGQFFGYPEETQGEVVFSTGMTGYPQSLTDPSYEGQILVLTYPLIGNYGIPNPIYLKKILQNLESPLIHVRGLIVSSNINEKSHWQAKKTLSQWLSENKIPALEGIDTRALTQKIREKGEMVGKIAKLPDLAEAQPTAGKTHLPAGGSKSQLKTKNFFNPNAINLVENVSCKEPIIYKNGRKKILLIDCGVKHSIIKSLFNLKCTIIRIPWNMGLLGFSLDQINGVVISNGPGDPKKLVETIKLIKEILKQKIPILGICLGSQLLCLAAGGDTYKLKYGHRSANQPVRLCRAQKAYITSQNHSYAVKMNSLGSSWQEWFVNLNDGTNEGIRHKRLPFMSVQFHPEGNPGPKDTKWIFEEFVGKIL